ncbi:MAG: F0F1 ATP synthase subunit A [Chloroflexi bacterium]|nr:F0F1 ATP synthase subunit A [Chloroflexota bacterium]
MAEARGTATPAAAVSRRGTRLLLFAAVALLALFLAGLVTGAIGAAFLGKDAGLLPRPHVQLAAEEVLNIGGLSLRNTVLSNWLAMLALALLVILATRNMKLVPGRLQSVVEIIVEGLLQFVESVIGQAKARSFLPIIGTIFLFVAFNAWIALLPIYPALVFPESVVEGGQQEVINVPLLRSAGTDLNMPLALALVSFVYVEFWGIRTLGFAYLGKFFRPGNLLRGRVFQGFIDLFVGLLELISELIRIVSFTFRLFGNMTAGEILLLVASFLVPFVFAVPFYGLELLVGFVQALIFAGLTLVFTAVAITPHEGEH